MTQNDAESGDRSEQIDIPEIDGDPWGEDRMYPLHEEWATGDIEGREYRILRSLQGPHILVEFEDMEEPIAYDIGDLLQHAHAHTNRSADTKTDQEASDAE